MSTQNQLRAPQHAEHTRKSSMEAHGTSSHQGEGTTFDRDIPSDRRSEATAQQSIRGSAFDEAYTSGRPPWDISQPQPAFVALAQAGRITGKVLDVGCGTGENALFLGQRGLVVEGQRRARCQQHDPAPKLTAGEPLPPVPVFQEIAHRSSEIRFVADGPAQSRWRASIQGRPAWDLRSHRTQGPSR